jgi:hypothetical protein
MSESLDNITALAKEVADQLSKKTNDPQFLEELREVISKATKLASSFEGADKIASFLLGAALFPIGHSFFMMAWSQFDLFIEILTMRQLRLSPREASIICAGMSFGAKINALYSLMSQEKDKEKGAQLIKDAHTMARRNSFSHGFFDYDDIKNVSLLVTREVKNEYSVAITEIEYKAMFKHLYKFLLKFKEALEYFAVTPADLIVYRKSILTDASDHSLRAKLRRESLANSQSAKRKRRPQPQTPA